MVIQAPVVKVRAAYGGDLPVAQALLGMAEARRILINLHACAKELLIIGARQKIRVNLVGNMRHDDDDLDPPLRRKGQRRDHIAVQDQVRRHDMHIALCPVDDVQIDIFRDVSTGRKFSE